MADDQTARKFVTKNEAVLLRAVADVKQQTVAEAMGKSHASYVSTFLSGKTSISLEEMLAMLDVCGLALHRCSDESVIVPADDWKSTMTYAKRYWADREA